MSYQKPPKPEILSVPLFPRGLSSLSEKWCFHCNIEKRQRGDSNPCGQSPMDFESISLTTRTHCLRGRQASPAPSSFSRKRQQEKWNLYPGDHAALSPLALSRKPEGVRNKEYSCVTASLHATQSPQWGSNPRPYAYEAYALPTEL